VRSELSSFAETQTSDHAQECFAADFVADWAKVMDADRF